MSEVPSQERVARAIAARAGEALRERVRFMLIDMDMADPTRHRLAASVEAEIDLVVAHADPDAWHDVVVSVAGDVLGGDVDAGSHPAVRMAEAILRDDARALA